MNNWSFSYYIGFCIMFGFTIYHLTTIINLLETIVTLLK